MKYVPHVHGINPMHQYVLYKLAGSRTDLLPGIDALLTDKINFKYLDHAVQALSDAKNEFNLKSAEASLQTMINEIKNMYQRGSGYMNTERTAQRLYTLQNLIFNLSAWQFDNGNENRYIPDILERYEKVVKKGQKVGIDGQTIRKACSIQFPISDPQLQNFMFLDEQNMENVSANLDRSRINSKRSINILQLNQAVITEPTPTANQDAGTYQIKTIDQPILDKMINFISNKLGNAKLSFTYIVNNIEQFYDLVGNIIHRKDRTTLAKVTGMITQRVMSFGQNVKLVIHKLNAKSMQILDKVSHIVRTKLGMGALNFQYIFTHLDLFFNVVGDALHTDDKYVLANVGEAVLQRVLTNSMQTTPQTSKTSNTTSMPVYSPQNEFINAFGYFPDRQI